MLVSMRLAFSCLLLDYHRRCLQHRACILSFVLCCTGLFYSIVLLDLIMGSARTEMWPLPFGNRCPLFSMDAAFGCPSELTC